ncbi:MAG: hypothetical protein UT30_C0004G0016 [Candidatus Uhrbacteria bacterium GW2011_GWF2_39_13]|uniref:Uncharacterized protein n=1 Tax=Candidatus Uhrbacteria bacterium GW2011_GWF2_39_13 TaxID=1618995 RepID=A0A0G0MNN0_9BACT|nr:MAG: hypothetical protein UT30_C0004G0016 [Candidatus Uhrbacteria bacterium GW2011_GWF2_39_13]
MSAFILLIFFFISLNSGGEETRPQSDLYFACDFETDCPLVPFCSNIDKPYNVNISLSKEKFSSGKTSCKVEVEIPENKKGNYFYLQIPLPNIPLRNPTMISMDIFNLGTGGCLGVIAKTADGKQMPWCYFPKKGQFYSKNERWQKLYFNIYPDFIKHCQNKNINSCDIIITKVWFRFSLKPPFKIAFFADNFSMDYLTYNMEAIGKSNSELFQIVKSKFNSISEEYESLLLIEHNAPYMKKLNDLKTRLHNFEKTLSDDNTHDMKGAADIRIKIDNMTNEVRNIIMDMELDELLRNPSLY